MENTHIRWTAITLELERLSH